MSRSLDMPKDRKPPRSIAIIGGGISGIACSWRLRNHDCDVHLYEADDRLGGHANSVPFEGRGTTVNVDTGFIAMDETTYPQFNHFLGELGIKTIPTDMSFGVSTADGSLEWGSYSLRSFIGTISNLFSPWFWRLMFDALRFSLFAIDLCYAPEPPKRPTEVDCEEPDTSPLLRWHTSSVAAVPAMEEEDSETIPFESIGDYITRQGYSRQFLTYYLIPLVAAPWCIDPDEFARSFPAKTLIQFMQDHGILGTVFKTLSWRSFKNGSKTYVDAFQKQLPARHKLHLKTPIQSITRLATDAGGGKVSVKLLDGTVRLYDHVVLAVHANQALSLLGHGATTLERKILSCFETRRNVCYLHSDTEFLPRRPSARVAWNCFVDEGQRATTHYCEDHDHEKTTEKGEINYPNSRISITFDMNKLQGIPFPSEPGSPGRVLVTMNPIRQPRTSQSSQVYYHPLLNARSLQMAERLHELHRDEPEGGRVSFAGAWMGFGFHEDGFAAGTHAADALIKGRDQIGRLNLISGTGGNRRKTNISLMEMMLRLFVDLVQRLISWV